MAGVRERIRARRGRGKPTERLCGHHEVADFSCGNADFDRLLLEYRERSNDGSLVQVFVTVEEKAVTGYIVVDEFLFRDLDDPEEPDLRLLHVSAIAVDTRHGTREVLSLINKVEDVIDAREGAANQAIFHAVVVPDPLLTDSLKKLLIKHEFIEPGMTGGIFWVRPIRRPSDEP